MSDIAARLPPGVKVFERGWLSSNNILIVGDDSTALVDSGYATHSTQTLDLVRGTLGARALDMLANTHLHSDHCGGNAGLQQAYPALRTLIPPGLSEHVRLWDPVALTYAPTGQQCPRFGFDALLTPGTRVELGGLAWEALAAPGHDPNSVILFEPESRTLLSADALWQNGFGVVFQELEGADAFGEVAATLDLIESLRPAIVVPGHGSTFTDVAGALVRSRSRLAAYEADPARHASHAAKVLLKFKLLELQKAALGALLNWAENTTYFQMVHTRWFGDRTMQIWLNGLMESLIESNAARRDGDQVFNC